MFLCADYGRRTFFILRRPTPTSRSFYNPQSETICVHFLSDLHLPIYDERTVLISSRSFPRHAGRFFLGFKKNHFITPLLEFIEKNCFKIAFDTAPNIYIAFVGAFLSVPFFALRFSHPHEHIAGVAVGKATVGDKPQRDRRPFGFADEVKRSVGYVKISVCDERGDIGRGLDGYG